MRKLTEEWARGIQSRIPMGSFGKRKFWPMSSWRSPRENEGLNIIIDSGEVGCRRMCPRYLNLESEMRSEDGTICWRNDSVEVRALDSKDLPEYFVVQAADPSNLSWRINLRFRSLEENCLYNLWVNPKFEFLGNEWVAKKRIQGFESGRCLRALEIDIRDGGRSRCNISLTAKCWS